MQLKYKAEVLIHSKKTISTCSQINDSTDKKHYCGKIKNRYSWDVLNKQGTVRH